MRENQLFTLIRSTLLAGFTREAGYADVEVQQLFQTVQVNAPEEPTVFMQVIGSHRVGSLRREEIPPVVPAVDFTHRETQWWETRLQISAFARRNPQELELPTAVDIAKMASNILQSDRGLAAMAVERVRPLRITDLRNLHITNESDQYEANPSFDVVLSYVEVRTDTTPPATPMPRFGRV